MLTGQNGILFTSLVQRAKEETEKAKINETNVLSSYEHVIYEATGDVPQVSDTNPGTLEGSGTEQDPYTINSIEDLVFFADDVTNGNNYEGKYVKLEYSLDFKSELSYVDSDIENFCGYNGALKNALTSGNGFCGIESTNPNANESVFYGRFDGNNCIISNLYMNGLYTDNAIGIGDYSIIIMGL